ncbi:polyprenol monophosphomannose synthase [Nocardioides okcheonensis]|uniref:polyprenol monophosphomannose synthase n=1 Tax=Nocardioides okcheonensis TaxID=2894081 RepID=UPI001E63CE4E|nr:polyprenol monophosphomannose synthase [Nocardioides okcheonensis]UFN42784.1 polyprenol monophosphomannose synthase [Nocardioides okcheonensis]
MNTLTDDVHQLVVLPTYNEVDNVAAAVESVLRLGTDYGVLVVDDSSPDGTAARALEVAARHPGRVELLTRAVKDGLGGAYRVGFARALQTKAGVVIQMDADGSHPVDRIPEMVGQVRGGAGLVLGSRYVPGGSLDEDWPWSRRAISRGGNLYARSILRLPVKDCTGGFKAWDAETLGGIDLASADAQGYAFQIQTTLQAIRAGARVVEVPIHFKERVLGTSKMTRRIASEAMVAVWRMRRRA